MDKEITKKKELTKEEAQRLYEALEPMIKAMSRLADWYISMVRDWQKFSETFIEIITRHLAETTGPCYSIKKGGMFRWLNNSLIGNQLRI